MLIFLDGIGRTRCRRTYYRLLLEINKQIMSKRLWQKSDTVPDYGISLRYQLPAQGYQVCQSIIHRNKSP